MPAQEEPRPTHARHRAARTVGRGLPRHPRLHRRRHPGGGRPGPDRQLQPQIRRAMADSRRRHGHGRRRAGARHRARSARRSAGLSRQGPRAVRVPGRRELRRARVQGRAGIRALLAAAARERPDHGAGVELPRRHRAPARGGGAPGERGPLPAGVRQHRGRHLDDRSPAQGHLRQPIHRASDRVRHRGAEAAAVEPPDDAGLGRGRAAEPRRRARRERRARAGRRPHDGSGDRAQGRLDAVGGVQDQLPARRRRRGARHPRRGARHFRAPPGRVGAALGGGRHRVGHRRGVLPHPRPAPGDGAGRAVGHRGRADRARAQAGAVPRVLGRRAGRRAVRIRSRRRAVRARDHGRPGGGVPGTARASSSHGTRSSRGSGRSRTSARPCATRRGGRSATWW